jgi:hypothetical protein
MHISGDNYQDGQCRGKGSYFFSRYPLSWGWASWRRAWRYYDVKVSMWPRAYRERWLESIFDEPEELKKWEGVFDSLYRGQIDTWDYQWVFACWRQGGLSIQPNKNLVSNIGVGPDATHFKETHSTVGIPTHDLGTLVHPAMVVRDEDADRYTFREHIAERPMAANWLVRLKRRLALRNRIKRAIPRSLRYWNLERV